MYIRFYNPETKQQRYVPVPAEETAEVYPSLIDALGAKLPVSLGATGKPQDAAKPDTSSKGTDFASTTPPELSESSDDEDDRTAAALVGLELRGCHNCRFEHVEGDVDPCLTCIVDENDDDMTPKWEPDEQYLEDNSEGILRYLRIMAAVANDDLFNGALKVDLVMHAEIPVDDDDEPQPEEPSAPAPARYDDVIRGEISKYLEEVAQHINEELFEGNKTVQVLMNVS